MTQTHGRMVNEAPAEHGVASSARLLQRGGDLRPWFASSTFRVTIDPLTAASVAT